MERRTKRQLQVEWIQSGLLDKVCAMNTIQSEKGNLPVTYRDARDMVIHEVAVRNNWLPDDYPESKYNMPEDTDWEALKKDVLMLSAYEQYRV